MIINKKYIAPATVSKFMRSDEFFRGILGPIGSGKSVGCCMEVFRRCCEIPPGPDGVRRSRWAVVRNTRQQLKDTTLKTWLEWFPSGAAGHWKESEGCFYLKVKDVEAEILFRPLDSPDDAARVLSLELTGAWLNESREIPKEIVEALQGRIGRYPARVTVPDYWCGMIADTNPPEEDSYWYRLFEHLPVEDNDPGTVMPMESFVQPSGLSPEAENVENLRPGYYEKLAVGKTKGWVDTYIRAMYSQSMSGKPVYQQFYKSNRHKVHNIAPSMYRPVIIGMDFGRTPAASFKQVDEMGRVLTICEATGFDMGIKTFAERYLRPILRTRFAHCPVVIIGDPAGVARNNTDDNNCFLELEEQFPEAYVMPGRTNDPLIRIQATEDLLRHFPDGEPAVVYSEECRMLLDGIRSKYRYRKRKAGEDFEDKPEKNKWSHIVEADQYANDFILHGYAASDYMRHGKVFVEDSYKVADSYTGY